MKKIKHAQGIYVTDITDTINELVDAVNALQSKVESTAQNSDSAPLTLDCADCGKPLGLSNIRCVQCEKRRQQRT